MSVLEETYRMTTARSPGKGRLLREEEEANVDQGMNGQMQEVRPGQIYREPDGDEIAILRLDGSSVLCSFDGQQQTELPLAWFYGSQVRLVQDWALCGDYPGDDQ